MDVVARWSLFSLCVACSTLWSSCGAPSPEETTPDELQFEEPTPEPAPAEETRMPEPVASPRALGPTATFAELTAAARTLDEQLAGDVESDCLLRGTGELGAAFRLEADLAVAVRPLAQPPADLADVVEQRGGKVAVLSRWGPRGETDDALVISSFTSTPPVTGVALVVFVTERGVYQRLTSGELSPELAGPFPLRRLETSLPSARPRGADVFVTASAGTSLTRLREALLFVPPGVVAALAVSLDSTVRPPATNTRGNRAGMCPDGLPASDVERGELDVERLRDALPPLTEAGARCFTTTRAESATGGRVEVAFRVSPDGSVDHACAVRDELGDAQLRECVLRAVRALRFPEPSGGAVDVQLPILLRPAERPAPAMICR